MCACSAIVNLGIIFYILYAYDVGLHFTACELQNYIIFCILYCTMTEFIEPQYSD